MTSLCVRCQSVMLCCCLSRCNCQRILYNNTITSMSNGAFAGLGNLMQLYEPWQALCNCAKFNVVLPGLSTTTPSHRYQTAHLQDLASCPLCKYSVDKFSFLPYAHSCSQLYKNAITSIYSGAFSGLANLTSLYICCSA